MDRNIIDYLPPIMKTSPEIKSVMHAEQPEFELAWDAADAVMRNLFIADADERGIARWERILSIPGKQSESLEGRRLKVLARLNEYLPYTKRALKRMLEAVCGSNDFSFEVDDQKNFEISAKSEKVSINADVLSMLDKVLPADMMIGIQVNSQASAYFGIASQQHIEYEGSALLHNYSLDYEAEALVEIGGKTAQEIVYCDL